MSAMNHAKTVALVVGAGAWAALVLAGVGYSLRAGHRLPAVDLQYDTVINSLAARKDYRRAIEQAEMALILNDSRLDKIRTYKSLADWYAVSGDTARSIDYCRRALRLREDDPSQHLMMGKLLEHQSKWDQAIDEYLRVLELNADQSEAHVRLGTIHERRLQYQQAVEHYRAAIQLDPADGVARQGIDRLKRVGAGRR